MATRTITRYRTRTVRAQSRRKAGFTIPLAPLAGLAVGVMPSIKYLLNGDYENAGTALVWRYTPYNPWQKKLDIGGLKHGLVPLIAGAMVHKFVGGSLGINKALARSGIPFIRI